MSKLKPKWVKTNIPTEIKIKLWRAMREKPTFVTWQQATAKNSALFSESELKYVPCSRDGYRSLQQEIREIPLDEVLLLPDDLQVWIKGLRPDLGNAEALHGSQVSANELATFKHWEELSSLAGQLVSLREQYNEGHPNGGYDGYIIDDPLMIELPHGLIACLISHMKSEFSEYEKISGWKDLLKIDISEEVILKLAFVAHRRKLKGTCLICPQEN